VIDCLYWIHHQINNPGRLALGTALALALATWAPDVRPKIHFSTQRTERLYYRKILLVQGKSAFMVMVLLLPWFLRMKVEFAGMGIQFRP
jgi:hypothetical protein